MESSTFLYEVNNNTWGKNEYPEDNFSDYNYKLTQKKVLFRLPSPIPSYQGESIRDDCEGSGSYDIDFQEPEPQSANHFNESLEKFSENSKKTKKDIKLRKKNDRLLSESEFIGIMKKIEQCQQVQDLIDNMATALKGFQMQLRKSHSFQRVK